MARGGETWQSFCCFDVFVVVVAAVDDVDVNVVIAVDVVKIVFAVHIIVVIVLAVDSITAEVVVFVYVDVGAAADASVVTIDAMAVAVVVVTLMYLSVTNNDTEGCAVIVIENVVIFIACALLAVVVADKDVLLLGLQMLWLVPINDANAFLIIIAAVFVVNKKIHYRCLPLSSFNVVDVSAVGND